MLSCGEKCQIFKNSFYRTPLVAPSENELLNYSSRFFLFKWMFMNFSNFLLWEVYPSIVVAEQYIFITYLWLRWQGKNLQQLKTWNFQHHKIILQFKLVFFKCFHFTCCLLQTSHSWYKYSWPFLMRKTMWYAQNSPCVQNSIFLSGKYIFPNPSINS